MKVTPFICLIVAMFFIALWVLRFEVTPQETLNYKCVDQSGEEVYRGPVASIFRDEEGITVLTGSNILEFDSSTRCVQIIN